MATTTAPPPDSSVSSMVATFIPAFLLALAYVSVFLCLRVSQRRWYAPRTYLGSMREEERTPELPKGLFNWVGPFRKIPDHYILQHQSLDSYLFLRFLKVAAMIAAVGAVLTWPILFPVNATGGGGQAGLNILAYANVNAKTSDGKNRLIAHALIGWVFFGFVLFTVCRESIYFVNLRQAYLLSPHSANRISSRTVLFTSVPKPYLDEAKLRQVFGESVKKIWITRDTTKLDKLFQDREEISMILEGAETKLIRAANEERLKAIKKGANPEEVEMTADAESGSLAARWVPAKKRPTYGTFTMCGFRWFGLFGKKVDTINWGRDQLRTAVPDTAAAQQEYLDGATEAIPAVFIEFFTQSQAQAAYQILSHHQALQMSPRYIGMSPTEIVWPSLQISWWQKVVRRYVVTGFIAVMIIFWAIPVAFVGTISNVPALEQISWLTWLQKIPASIIGIISGFLPAVMLAILMSLVPIVMRICAKLAGEPTLARVELFTQNAYFVFQVVQVFLVVTLGSAATAVLNQIENDPASAASLLATNLPKASNIYISYFLLQGLAIASQGLAGIVGLIIFKVLYKLLPSTPRAMYLKWTSLSGISWGSVLPVYANIVVIGITYAMIAPLILGFAAVGLFLFYFAFRYQILFITDSTIDTKGLIYPRALQHILTGVYLGEVCMIGLFAISEAPAPTILTALFLVFTILFHLSMNSALNPLLYNLPKSLESEEESLLAEASAAEPESEKTAKATEATAPQPEAGLIMKFLKPHIYSDYATLRKLIPNDFLDVSNLYTPTDEDNAYLPPSVYTPAATLWIPRDTMGISAQEIAHTSKVIKITDEGASLDEKNKIVWDADNSRPPVWLPKIYY